MKHLRILGMDRVAAAIHVHGMGLADNAVNVTYQFLARKVTMLSQVSIALPTGAAPSGKCPAEPLLSLTALQNTSAPQDMLSCCAARGGSLLPSDASISCQKPC